MEELYDAIVVGGGPGGSSAAAFLSSKGKKVLLIEKEKWPRDKTCGDAISGKSIKILNELGLIDAIEKSEHADVEGVTFSSPEGKVVTIKFNREGKGINKGYVCRREIFDNILWNKAKETADTLEESQVVDVIKENEKIVGVKVKHKDESIEEYKGKIIIGADGVSSLVAKAIRGQDVDPEHTCIAYRAYYQNVSELENNLEIHFVKSVMPGYFWIFPSGNKAANVGIGMVMKDMKKNNINLQKAMLDAIANNPLFAERFKNAKQITPIKAWSLPFGSKKRKVHAENVLLVGDAAGLVDPFSGEGIGNALLSGKLAAEIANESLEKNDQSEQFLAKYESVLWGTVGKELEQSYTMQKLGKQQWLLNFVIAKAAKSEKARELIAGTFSNEEAKNEYKSPLFYIKLLLS